MSIEEESERVFVENNINLKNLTAIKYFIGLRKDQHSGKWKWLSNGKLVDASTKGKHPWASGQPSGATGSNCTTIYSNYKTHLGLFDDLRCSRPQKDAGYICERHVSCTKDQKGRSL